MDKDEYEDKISAPLSNESTYKILPPFPLEIYNHKDAASINSDGLSYWSEYSLDLEVFFIKSVFWTSIRPGICKCWSWYILTW